MSDIAFVERMEKRWASTSKKRIGDIDQQKLLELARTGAEAADLITALRAEVERREQSFDLRWKADMRAIKRWQEAHPGNDLNWPDHADLVVWLLERDAALRAETEKLRAALREIASGKYSGIVLTSYPPQDPAVNRARTALEEKQ